MGEGGATVGAGAAGAVGWLDSAGPQRRMAIRRITASSSAPPSQGSHRRCRPSEVCSSVATGTGRFACRPPSVSMRSGCRHAPAVGAAKAFRCRASSRTVASETPEGMLHRPTPQPSEMDSSGGRSLGRRSTASWNLAWAGSMAQRPEDLAESSAS
ncbi:MAG: hypothetical protein EBQ99_07585 [Planctomycetes bacterium]|nr:hypothetical protein [Planctomycetota bacterium]